MRKGTGRINPEYVSLPRGAEDRQKERGHAQHLFIHFFCLHVFMNKKKPIYFIIIKK